MTVQNYSKIPSKIVFLVVLVHGDLLNIGFKCREASCSEDAS